MADTETQFWDLLAQLQRSNQAIIALENMMRQSKAVAAAVGADVLTARKQQNNLAQQFTTVYRAVTGSVPPGIQGMRGLGAARGLGAIAVPAWAVVTVISLLSASALLWEYIQALQTRASAALLAEQNRATLLAQATQKDQQAAAAQAAGNVNEARRLADEAQQLRNQAGAPTGGQQDFNQWFQDNWQWLAVVALGIVIVPPLLER